MVFPYRYLVSILEMLEAMDKLAPGVNSNHTLLYGVEVKFYSSRPTLSSSLETQIKIYLPLVMEQVLQEV